MREFLKPITVEIQHCAKAENVGKLSFARAVCSQKQLPYTFKELPGGIFSSHSSYGVIDLNRFSGVVAAQKGSDECRYVTTVYYKETTSLCHPFIEEIYFAVTYASDPHRRVSWCTHVLSWF